MLQQNSEIQWGSMLEGADIDKINKNLKNVN